MQTAADTCLKNLKQWRCAFVKPLHEQEVEAFSVVGEDGGMVVSIVHSGWCTIGLQKLLRATGYVVKG